MAPSAVTTTLSALHDEPRRVLTLLRGADRAAETIRVALTRRIGPDVVLVDVQMPGLDCVDATRVMLVEPGELATAVRLLGRGRRQRAHRRNRNQSCWEDGMLTPKVIEIRRGCAHGTPVAPLPKATAGARQHAE
jgi:CheY-like chemotaxis protein